MTLLIHSMSEFGDLILPALDIAGAREIVEIGAEFGGTSQALADRAAANDGRLTSIDPAPKPEFLDWAAATPAVRHLAIPSLDAFAELADVDAWIIDGDHNWYTVFNELTQARAACRRDARPLLAFLHDVDWPCGRRDMYYAPDAIPARYRHAHSFDAGALPEQDVLIPGRGFRGCGAFAWALHEGGPRNGVLTAIEDFIAASKADGDALCYAQVPAVFGLGVLFDANAPWAEAMARHFMPYHQNPLLATLERNRLANYLAVIDWQDRAAQAA
jgi:hypothetical protein